MPGPKGASKYIFNIRERFKYEGFRFDGGGHALVPREGSQPADPADPAGAGGVHKELCGAQVRLTNRLVKTETD